jgi:hypothetical protein
MQVRLCISIIMSDHLKRYHIFHTFLINLYNILLPLIHLQGIVNSDIWFGFVYGVYRHFQQYFSYILAVSFFRGKPEYPDKNHRPVTSR